MNPTSTRTATAILTVILVAGFVLRLNGIDWGTDPDTNVFHFFHPDETTIIKNSNLVGTDLRQIQMPYGFFPAYLLWSLSKLTGHSLTFDSHESTRSAFLLARTITLLLSVAAIWAVFAIGKKLSDAVTGLIAAALLACSYGHIQQSHYYTVDPLLTTIVLFAVLLIMRLPSDRYIDYAMCGLLVGLSIGTRLAGVLLIVPFTIQLLPPNSLRRPVEAMRALISCKTGLFGFTVVLSGIACEPFALLEPARFFGRHALLTWRRSLEVSLGEEVFPWSLYDFNTTPFLFHITDLLPYTMGEILFPIALIGCLIALRQPHRTVLVLLSWIVVYFLAVGGHHLKPVRYVLPLIPFLTIFAARLCTECWRHISFRPIKYGVPVLVLVPSLALGLTTWNVFARTDSRIEAMRWINANISKEDIMLTEVGGFPSARLFPEHRNKKVVNTNYFLHTKNCGTNLAKIHYVKKRLEGASWIALIEENRERQFLAAAEAYPVGAGFYTKLKNRTLGYVPVAQFKVNPGVGPIEFPRPYNEPTMTAFDHPTTTIYRLENSSIVHRSMAEWVQRQQQHADEILLAKGALAIQSGKIEEAKAHLQRFTDHNPDLLIGLLLLREANGSEGSLTWAGHPYQFCMEEIIDQLIQLQLPTLALQTAEMFIDHNPSETYPVDLANLYHSAARIAHGLGENRRAFSHYENACQLDENRWELRLGFAQICLRLGRFDEAIAAFKNVLRYQPTNADALRALAAMRNQLKGLP